MKSNRVGYIYIFIFFISHLDQISVCLIHIIFELILTITLFYIVLLSNFIILTFIFKVSIISWNFQNAHFQEIKTLSKFLRSTHFEFSTLVQDYVKELNCNLMCPLKLENKNLHNVLFMITHQLKMSYDIFLLEKKIEFVQLSHINYCVVRLLLRCFDVSILKAE